MLIALGASQVIHPSFGLLVLVAALWLIGCLIAWYKRTFSFTDDGRLIIRERLLGTADNVVNLFGQVRQSQSILGRLLDYGDLEVLQMGHTLHLQCIGNFSDFVRLIEGVPMQPTFG